MQIKDDTSLYRLVNLKKYYNSNFSLDIPYLNIKRGKSIGIIGLNGSGKSTLCRLLAFIESPSMGEIYFQGIKCTTENFKISRRITMLLQNPYLLKRSVFDNVAYGLKVRGERKNILKDVNEALQSVGLSPTKYAKRKCFELSGGEAQRVALASRLIIRPEVLILDEPTSNIDNLNASLIKEAILRIKNKYNTSLILSSHDHIWLNSIADDIIRIHDGRIASSGIKKVIEGPMVSWYRYFMI